MPDVDLTDVSSDSVAEFASTTLLNAKRKALLSVGDTTNFTLTKAPLPVSRCFKIERKSNQLMFHFE